MVQPGDILGALGLDLASGPNGCLLSDLTLRKTRGMSKYENCCSRTSLDSSRTMSRYLPEVWHIGDRGALETSSRNRGDC